MKIIESKIVGKKSLDACEDGLVVTDDFIAVIDGSTSKTPRRLNPEMKNGRYAMLLISEYIREELKGKASVDDFCRGITSYISNKVYGPLGMTERLAQHPEERLTASAVLYSRARRETWMVGDCQAIIGGKFYENGKPYEREIAQKRVSLIKGGMSPAEARKQIEPLLIEAMLSGQNKSYAVIDGFSIYQDGVVVISAPESSEVVLASDGYPFLCPTLAESEDALAEQIAHDPQNINTFFATKGLVEGNNGFDDRRMSAFVNNTQKPMNVLVCTKIAIHTLRKCSSSFSLGMSAVAW